MTVSAYQIIYAGEPGYGDTFTYGDAAAVAFGMGLKVASIDSAAENDYIHSIIDRFYAFNEGIWIDYSGTFAAWAPGYPVFAGQPQPYLNNADINSGWRNDLAQVSSVLVELEVARFVGDPFNVSAVFSVRPGMVLEGRENTDIFVGTAGAETLIGGGGSDALYGGPNVLEGGGGADLFFDGDGADMVIGSAQSTLKAALDGDDDYYQVGKVDYSAATEDIAITVWFGSYRAEAFNERSFQYGSEDPQTARNEIGHDDLTGTVRLNGAVYTGSGNDNIGWTGRLANTGPGDDTIYGYSDFLIAEGGDGDDDIFLMGHGGRAIGGPGRDYLQADSDGLGGAHEMTGGAGQDAFVFSGFDTTGSRQIVWDMRASGPEEDRLVFEQMFAGPPPTSVQTAIDTGHLRIRYDHGYTYLDIDGNGGGDQFDATFVLKGVFGADLYDNIIFR